MRKEEFCELLGDIDEKHIAEARKPAKVKKTVWTKVCAAAACLGIIVAGTLIWKERVTVPGGGVDAGGTITGEDGTWPEGIDPKIASVAIFPAGEKLKNVSDATVTSVSEADARNIETLGDYLPKVLPDGVIYGPAGYYETTMKDGTRYHMLRVTYWSGKLPEPAPVPENAEISTEAVTGSNAFLWMVWGHRPDTERPVYQPEEITAELIEDAGGSVFYIDYGDVYVGIEKLEISTQDMLAVINSIG